MYSPRVELPSRTTPSLASPARISPGGQFEDGDSPASSPRAASSPRPPRGQSARPRRGSVTSLSQHVPGSPTSGPGHGPAPSTPRRMSRASQSGAGGFPRHDTSRSSNTGDGRGVRSAVGPESPVFRTVTPPPALGDVDEMLEELDGGTGEARRAADGTRVRLVDQLMAEGSDSEPEPEPPSPMAARGALPGAHLAALAEAGESRVSSSGSAAGLMEMLDSRQHRAHVLGNKGSVDTHLRRLRERNEVLGSLQQWANTVLTTRADEFGGLDAEASDLEHVDAEQLDFGDEAPPTQQLQLLQSPQSARIASPAVGGVGASLKAHFQETVSEEVAARFVKIRERWESEIAGEMEELTLLREQNRSLKRANAEWRQAATQQHARLEVLHANLPHRATRDTNPPPPLPKDNAEAKYKMKLAEATLVNRALDARLKQAQEALQASQNMRAHERISHAGAPDSSDTYHTKSASHKKHGKTNRPTALIIQDEDSEDGELYEPRDALAGHVAGHITEEEGMAEHLPQQGATPHAAAETPSGDHAGDGIHHPDGAHHGHKAAHGKGGKKAKAGASAAHKATAKEAKDHAKEIDRLRKEVDKLHRDLETKGTEVTKLQAGLKQAHQRPHTAHAADSHSHPQHPHPHTEPSHLAPNSPGMGAGDRSTTPAPHGRSRRVSNADTADGARTPPLSPKPQHPLLSAASRHSVANGGGGEASGVTSDSLLEYAGSSDGRKPGSGGASTLSRQRSQEVPNSRLPPSRPRSATGTAAPVLSSPSLVRPGSGAPVPRPTSGSSQNATLAMRSKLSRNLARSLSAQQRGGSQLDVGGADGTAGSPRDSTGAELHPLSNSASGMLEQVSEGSAAEGADAQWDLSTTDIVGGKASDGSRGSSRSPRRPVALPPPPMSGPKGAAGRSSSSSARAASGSPGGTRTSASGTTGGGSRTPGGRTPTAGPSPLPRSRTPVGGGVQDHARLPWPSGKEGLEVDLMQLDDDALRRQPSAPFDGPPVQAHDPQWLVTLEARMASVVRAAMQDGLPMEDLGGRLQSVFRSAASDLTLGEASSTLGPVSGSRPVSAGGSAFSAFTGAPATHSGAPSARGDRPSQQGTALRSRPVSAAPLRHSAPPSPGGSITAVAAAAAAPNPSPPASPGRVSSAGGGLTPGELGSPDSSSPTPGGLLAFADPGLPYLGPPPEMWAPSPARDVASASPSGPHHDMLLRQASSNDASKQRFPALPDPSVAWPSHSAQPSPLGGGFVAGTFGSGRVSGNGRMGSGVRTAGGSASGNTNVGGDTGGGEGLIFAAASRLFAPSAGSSSHFAGDGLEGTADGWESGAPPPPDQALGGDYSRSLSRQGSPVGRAPVPPGGERSASVGLVVHTSTVSPHGAGPHMAQSTAGLLQRQQYMLSRQYDPNYATLHSTRLPLPVHSSPPSTQHDPSPPRDSRPHSDSGYASAGGTAASSTPQLQAPWAAPRGAGGAGHMSARGYGDSYGGGDGGGGSMVEGLDGNLREVVFIRSMALVGGNGRPQSAAVSWQHGIAPRGQLLSRPTSSSRPTSAVPAAANGKTSTLRPSSAVPHPDRQAAVALPVSPLRTSNNPYYPTNTKHGGLVLPVRHNVSTPQKGFTQGRDRQASPPRGVVPERGRATLDLMSDDYGIQMPQPVPPAVTQHIIHPTSGLMPPGLGFQLFMDGAPVGAVLRRAAQGGHSGGGASGGGGAAAGGDAFADPLPGSRAELHQQLRAAHHVMVEMNARLKATATELAASEELRRELKVEVETTRAHWVAENDYSRMLTAEVLQLNAAAALASSEAAAQAAARAAAEAARLEEEEAEAARAAAEAEAEAAAAAEEAMLVAQEAAAAAVLEGSNAFTPAADSLEPVEEGEEGGAADATASGDGANGAVDGEAVSATATTTVKGAAGVVAQRQAEAEPGPLTVTFAD